ncbi:hypothetical protein DVH24_021180 [Malus domestica]|uniref:Uncharacterized protein n=1 Tax=Malus domestica TaxID=3750 RepID=A0A498JBJ5_MALDO|nr:hypothetical protein DVH24_021180 [Malus domestica]
MASLPSQFPYTLIPSYLCGHGRTQCTRLPLYAGSGRGECRLALPPFMERLFPSLEPETYRSWAKALAIAPSATSPLGNIDSKKYYLTNVVGNVP